MEADPHDLCTISPSKYRDYKAVVSYMLGDKRKRKFFGTMREAIFWVENDFPDVMARFKMGIVDFTFSDAFDFYVTESERGRAGREPVSASHLTKLKRLKRLHLDNDPIMEKSISATPPRECSAFMRRMRDTKEYKKAEAAAYLKSAVSLAFNEGMITEDPMAGAKPPSKPKGKGVERLTNKDIPTRAEVRDLLSAAREEALTRTGYLSVASWRFYAMFATACYAGLRLSEIRALPVANVLFDRKFILVHQTVEHETTEIKKPKSNAGYRQVPLPDELASIYQEWLDVRPSDHELLFPTKNGTPVAKRGASRMMESFLKRQGVEGLAWHGFRHFFASNLIDANVDLKRLQTYLGHAEIQTTFDVYGHLMRDDEGFVAAI